MLGTRGRGGCVGLRGGTPACVGQTGLATECSGPPLAVCSACATRNCSLPPSSTKQSLVRYPCLALHWVAQPFSQDLVVVVESKTPSNKQDGQAGGGNCWVWSSLVWVMPAVSLDGYGPSALQISGCQGLFHRGQQQ